MATVAPPSVGPRQDRVGVEIPSRVGATIYDQRTAQALDDLRKRIPATGVAVADFGKAPGSPMATVLIRDQAGIVASSLVHAEIRPQATPDHSVDEHLLEPLRVIAGSIVPGQGFSIYVIYAGLGDSMAYGHWTVAWSWN